jgi:membrane-associated phospholipid phosphatase
VGALVALAVLAWGNDVRAAEPERTSGAYELSLDFDLPLFLIAGGMASSFLFMNETAAPPCAPLCNKDDVNVIDRPFAGMYSRSWQITGDIATASTLILVPAGLVLGEPNRHVWGDLLVVGEAVMVTSALQVPLSYATGRPRPRVYGTEAPLDDRDDANAGRSFFSGHVANCIAGTMVAATALRRLGKRELSWAVLGVGLAGSAVVGISRVAAGGHFPSDVVVGAAVGVGVGLAIPALHEQKLQVQPMAGRQTGGVAIAGMWR